MPASPSVRVVAFLPTGHTSLQKRKSTPRKRFNAATQMKTILDIVRVSGNRARHQRKEKLMGTIGTLVTIFVALAIIFVPQLLVAYFAGDMDESASAHDEYVSDGR